MIDGVYKTVQTILNKNNYGVLTPDRFNTLARDAQLKIVYELPNELRQAKNRVNNVRGGKGSTAAVNQIESALSVFDTEMIIKRIPDPSTTSGFSDYFPLPDDVMTIHLLTYKDCYPIEKAGKCIAYLRCHYIIAPNEEYPVYEQRENKVYVSPSNIGLDIGFPTIANEDVKIYYQRTPKEPNWTFTVLNGQSVFNPTATNYQDFELPEFMFDRLVVEICALAGVHLREELVVQYMTAEQQQMLQSKLQN